MEYFDCFSLLDKKPNTYTYTKALTEKLISTYSKHLPVAIIRPSIGKIYVINDSCNKIYNKD